jgi:hypothetical protein
MALALPLALGACARKDTAPAATASPAASASSDPDTGTTSADYGGPGRTGLPSDEADEASAASASTAGSRPVKIRVIAIDPGAPSITAIAANAKTTGPAAEKAASRTVPVLPAAAATLQGLKPGDRVTLMCAEPAEGSAPATGAATTAQPSDLKDCDMVLAIVQGQ